MDREQKVRFSATDNGVSSFMKKLQSDTKSLYSDFLKEAQKQTNNQREQLKIVEQQIKALERQNNLEKEQNRILLERRRAAGVITPTDFQKQIHQLRGDTAVSAVQTSILKDMLGTLKDQQKKEEKPSTGKQIFSAVLMAGLIRDVLSTLRGTATAQTGLDLLAPMAGVAGAGIGAASGLFMLPSLTIAGKEIGGFAGSAFTRHIRTQEEYARAMNKYGALTGGGLGLPSMSYMGYSGIDTAAAAGNLARSGGRQLTVNDIRGFLGLSRGFGIDEGVMTGTFGGERSGGGNATTRMQRVLGVAIAEGLDRAKFTDAIKNQNQLLAQFAQTSNKVSDDRINQILFEFNRMGGMFTIGDPRSMERISSINESLANPNSGFAQAMNYSVLRKLNPTASIWNLVGQQERGLQTPGFFKGVLDQYSQMGVSEDFQKIMFKERFKLSNQAIDTLFGNRRGLETMSQEDLNKILSQGKIAGEAEKYTNRLTKYEAETSDAFRESMMKGVTTIARQFGDEMKIAIDEVAAYYKKNAGSGEEMFTPRTEAVIPSSVQNWFSSMFNSFIEFQKMPHSKQSKGAR